MASPSSAAEDGSVMASWFSFSCAKPRNERSSLLEENLAAKAETQPSCVRCQSDESNLSDANASLLSEASTAPGIRDGSPPKRRTSFADQQGQPIEKMCACPAPPKACNHPNCNRAAQLILLLPCAQILRPFARRCRGVDGRG